MRKKKQKNKKNNYIKKQTILLFLLIILIISFANSIARYVSNSINSFFARSKEFYFYSDKMSENTDVFQINEWTGVDPYTFTIDMNSRKNNIEGATYDIAYNINYKCTPNAICQISKDKGIISANTNSDLFYVTIIPNTQLKVGDKVVVEVEAVSDSIYNKTIKGRYTLVVGKEKISYSIEDKIKSQYMTLNITNTISYYIVKEPFENYSVGEKLDVDTYKKLIKENKDKCYSKIVDIKFNPKEILLDMTDEILKNAYNIKKIQINGNTFVSGFTIEMQPISSEKIRFYKIDNLKDYTYPNDLQNNSIIEIKSK